MSVLHCSVIDCDRNSDKHGFNSQFKTLFYPFPIKDIKQRHLWIEATLRKQWKPDDTSRICSEHFFLKRPSRIDSHPDYVPTIFPCRKTTIITDEQSNKISLKEVLSYRCQFCENKLILPSQLEGHIRYHNITHNKRHFSRIAFVKNQQCEKTDLNKWVDKTELVEKTKRNEINNDLINLPPSNSKQIDETLIKPSSFNEEDLSNKIFIPETPSKDIVLRSKKPSIEKPIQTNSPNLKVVVPKSTNSAIQKPNQIKPTKSLKKLNEAELNKLIPSLRYNPQQRRIFIVQKKIQRKIANHDTNTNHKNTRQNIKEKTTNHEIDAKHRNNDIKKENTSHEINEKFTNNVIDAEYTSTHNDEGVDPLRIKSEIFDDDDAELILPTF